MKYKFYKPKLWKRILGWLGVKKYEVNYSWGVDFGSGDMTVEVFGHYDKDGILSIEYFKVK